jgi:hypothetical protein
MGYTFDERARCAKCGRTWLVQFMRGGLCGICWSLQFYQPRAKP